MKRVTTILRDVFGEPSVFGDAEDKAFWMERGTAVHKATELYDKGTLNVCGLDYRIKPRVLSWMKFRNEVGGKIIGNETEVVNKHLGYVGHLDRMIRGSRMWPNHDLLVDIKCGKPWPICALQLMAYKLAWLETKRTRKKIKRVAVHLSDEGYQLYPFEDDQRDAVGWYACCNPTEINKQIIGKWALQFGTYGKV